ncbi:MAG: glycosyltransferase family 2 protein [Alcanivoracaceae bacterium]
MSAYAAAIAEAVCIAKDVSTYIVKDESTVSTPWLSVLIPVFNVEDYLTDCLDSVIEQLDSGVEVVVLDDCSTDSSYQRLCAYAESSRHPIRILRHDANGGISAARNSLIDNASGDYLWFLDSDDLMAAGAIQALRAIVLAHSPDLVLCDYRRWRSDTDFHATSLLGYMASFKGPAERLLDDPEALFSGLYAMGRLHAWSKISKRQLWTADIRFPEGRYFEDMVAMPRMALKAKTYYYCPQPWIIYRQRSGSIVSSFTIQKIDDMVAGLAGIFSLWRSEHPDMSLRTRYFFARFALRIHTYARKELRKMEHNSAERLHEYGQQIREHIGMSRKEVAWCFLASGDVFRLIKMIRFLYL